MGGEEQPEVPDDELRELLFTGLRLAGDQRRVLEARESACIAALRGLGATWKQIAEALELGSPAAAHQHAARLARRRDRGSSSCADPAPLGEPRAVLLSAETPLRPGSVVRMLVPRGCTMFGGMPPPDGWGFTVGGESGRWRSVVRSATEDAGGGWTLELEVEGRYAADLPQG